MPIDNTLTHQRARRFSRGRVAIFFLIVIGFILWDGNRKTPTPPASGIEFNGPLASTRPGDFLRVATFNMAGGVGDKDNRLDLNRTADAIRGYDLVGLQEVHGRTFFDSRDQAQILGESLKLPWLFAPVETQWWHDAFGSGAITDLPVIHWQRFPLSDKGARDNRNVLLLRLSYHDKPLNVLITHLDRHEDHESELLSIIELFESLDKPAILLADLNSDFQPVPDPQMPKLQALADATGIHLADRREGNLDWIFARGMHAVHSGFFNNGASDHNLEWAELQLDDSK